MVEVIPSQVMARPFVTRSLNSLAYFLKNMEGNTVRSHYHESIQGSVAIVFKHMLRIWVEAQRPVILKYGCCIPAVWVVKVDIL